MVRGGTAAPLRKRSFEKRSGTFWKFQVQEENGKEKPNFDVYRFDLCMFPTLVQLSAVFGASAVE